MQQTDTLLPCPLCSQPHFPSVQSLRDCLIAAATRHLPCPVCDEKLLGLDKLTIHLFGHLQDTIHMVINAGCATSTDSSRFPLVENSVCYSGITEVEERKEPEEIFTSNTCPGELPSTLFDQPEEKTRCYCEICNLDFSDQKILDLHVKLIHSSYKENNNEHYPCHLCSKQFKMRGSLMVHLRVAHYGFSYSPASSGKVTDCSTEQRSEAASPESLSNHSHVDGGVKQSSDMKEWRCDTCSKTFTTKYFLKKHKRLHTGEMPYFCNLCNKSFTFQQSYHKHMLYHTSDKPHVCSDCGRAFKELSTLHNHRRIHTGERPFACEICGKCFRQRVSYLVHKRIHTGVLPYKCNICNKNFRYKVSQRSHKCLPTATPPETPESTTTSILPQQLSPGNTEELSQSAADESSDNGKTNSTLFYEDIPNIDFFSMIMSPGPIQSASEQFESLHITNNSRTSPDLRDFLNTNFDLT